MSDILSRYDAETCYLIGQMEAEMNLPAGQHSPEYILGLTRTDATKGRMRDPKSGKCGPGKTWVDDPRAKGGGYCRRIEGGGGGGNLGRNLAIGAGVAALGAGGALAADPRSRKAIGEGAKEIGGIAGGAADKAKFYTKMAELQKEMGDEKGAEETIKSRREQIGEDLALAGDVINRTARKATIGAQRGIQRVTRAPRRAVNEIRQAAEGDLKAIKKTAEAGRGLIDKTRERTGKKVKGNVEEAVKRAKGGDYRGAAEQVGKAVQNVVKGTNSAAGIASETARLSAQELNRRRRK